ncbi:putative ATPase [Catenuloplanes atrovinosus]|uniref:ATPase n=1 Tax=Catenuloplanes atrovinosus TaxID=137266 RepID=A0AAE3YI63_9ACTN|nr:replication-associated recombination protein A [Catenuloplanes atrovinosus]MDR7274144.1 putative ATPase [Catenuloplanes atrovinosus]
MEVEGLFAVTETGGVSVTPDRNGTGSALDAQGASFVAPGEDSPLAVRMRPRVIDELVGQSHLLAPGAPLRQLVGGDTPMSVILWGPPGSGKTTIAHLVAGATNRRFVAMSALSAGVKDVRAVIDAARRERRYGGPPTVLFIDEVHRFSKTQQDSLLAAVEDRTVTLLAATTENPYFSVISPLLSRCVLLTLHPLTEDDVRGLIDRALTDPRGLGGTLTIAEDAVEHLIRLAGGDVRKALTALEAAASSALAQGATEIDLATAEQAVDVAAVRYDRAGDAHYDVTSAFIKSMRGSDPDAALHWLARMLVAGEDARFIARRLVIFASEDVGMADPTALQVATAAAQAVQLIGLPEAGLNLSQAVIHLATAPKSNSATTALSAAIADVRAGRGGPVPRHLRDAHYPGAKGLGHGTGYRYPHDDARGVVRQQYAPDDLAAVEYYTPTDRGFEREVAERLPKLRRVVRGTPVPPRRESRMAGAGPAAPAPGAGSVVPGDSGPAAVSSAPAAVFSSPAVVPEAPAVVSQVPGDAAPMGVAESAEPPAVGAVSDRTAGAGGTASAQATATESATGTDRLTGSAGDGGTSEAVEDDGRPAVPEHAEGPEQGRSAGGRRKAGGRRRTPEPPVEAGA